MIEIFDLKLIVDRSIEEKNVPMNSNIYIYIYIYNIYIYIPTSEY